MEELVAGLNNEQLEAVTYNENSVLRVIAGPGTGKTKVLTARFCHLVIKKKIHPLRIIMTTFTKKAANEIKQRLQPIMREFGISTEGLLIGTFHSIFARVLHQWGHLINLPKNWSIAKKDDIISILKSIIEEAPENIRTLFNADFNLNDEKCNARLLLSLISDVKASGILPAEYGELKNHKASLLYCYNRLQELLLSEMLLDFDDILLYGKLLMKNHNVWKHICHVLVDEFQDTNDLQLDLIYLLARVNPNACNGFTVVGDPDQSIYAFRFASANNFNKVIEMSPIHHATVSLVENYRSAQSILDLSETVICQQKTHRIVRDPLRGQFNHNVKPFYFSFRRMDTFEGNTEANGIAREIIYLIALGKVYSYSDIAILLRTRRQFDDIEKSLIHYRIPYTIVNAKKIWEKKECAVFLDFLRLLTQEFCSLGLLRCLDFSAKGVGSVTLKRLKLALDQTSTLPTLAALESFNRKCNAKNKIANEGIQKFLDLIERCRRICVRSSSYDDLKELFQVIYSGLGFSTLISGKNWETDTPFEKYCDQSDFEKHLMKTPALYTVYQNFVNFKTTGSDENIEIIEDEQTSPKLRFQIFNPSQFDMLEVLRLFSKSVSLYSSEAETPGNSESKSKNECVTISTIHAAKGLEWAVCFIPSINEGLIPFEDKSLAQGIEDIEELSHTNLVVRDSINLEVSTEGIIRENLRHQLSMKEKIEDNISEERRIFFVALTRAKHLLYLSSSGKKSRFLSSCQKNYSLHNEMYESEHTVKKFYEALGKQYIQHDSISLSTLFNDYQKFQKLKKEVMIWNGNEIPLHLPVNYGNNIKPTNMIKKSTFLTTASQLLETSGHVKGKFWGEKVSGSSSKIASPYRYGTKITKSSGNDAKKRKRILTDFFNVSKGARTEPIQPSKILESLENTESPKTLAETNNEYRSNKLPTKNNCAIIPGKIGPKKSFAPSYTPIRNNSKRRTKIAAYSDLSTQGSQSSRES